MPEVLVVPLKKPSDVDIVKPLKNLIQSAYNSASDQQTADYSDAVNAFSKLRGEALWKAFDKSEVSLELLSNYYDQICSLETKIPAQELQVPFKWKDAFDKGSIFGGRQSLTLSSLSFEKVCILFNIGALLSALAAAENLDSDDGLKLAAKYFQKAAGIFNHLRGVSPAAIPQQPTQDLAAETLTVMSSLMAAQAQEMFIHKAIRDNMKDQIIANLCCQCEEMYADVLRGMQKEAVRSLWEKEWVPLVAGKQAAYHAMTQFYQSLVCRAKKSVGAEIALLQDAVELFKSAQSRSGKADLFEEFAAKAQRNLTESKKDNDFIYNEMIPDVKTLPACGKVQLAKPLPVTTPIGSSFKDLFAELVPVAVHRAMAICDQRKTEGVNQEIMKLREASLKMNSLLASHNLPAAIEVTDCGSLPQSLLDKTRSVREQGGVDSIRSLLTELPELLNRNREILDECERVLNEEQQSDHKLRAQFKEKWTRTPSEKLTELFRSNAEKYRVIINNAVQADKVVRDKFETHSHGFEMLSKDENALQQATPSGSGVDIASCSAAQKLRSLMEQVETIKVEREVIESELKSVTVDMREEFLKALAQDGAIDENALTATHVGQAINPLRKQVDDSLARQAALENEINAAQQEFQTQTGGGSNGSRDDFFKELASAYDSFIELKTNLQEGTKFYNDLTNILVVFQNKITDFCFARKTEKDELMKDLTQQSSRTAPAVAPQAPSHFGSTTDGSGGSVPQRTAPPAPTDPAYAPYPTQMQGMPMPYGATAAAPYPTYVAPPMPQAFYPYATLPYPTNAYAYPNFPQGPQPPQGYNTYPGNYGNQPQPPQWPPQ